ncbi:hypothetical protein KAH81_02985 [bacterium]|nr:hypothetical protein [bacterium]
MKKQKISKALALAFKVLTFSFGILGLIMLVLIFATPDIMVIGIQGINICAGDITLEDRIIMSGFVLVTVFLAILTASFLARAFSSLSNMRSKEKILGFFENSGYIILAWAIYSIGEKISMPFFNIITAQNHIVKAYYGDAIMLFFVGLVIVIASVVYRKSI